LHCNESSIDQALNFFALGGFSPLRILSAPNDLPFAGQPYFGPNTLCQTLQELPEHMMTRQIKNTSILRVADIRVNLFYQRL
jgi:hypothetical protein